MRSFARAGAIALALLGAPAFAADFTDAAGRIVAVPDKVDRVFAAGPPATIVVFTLAPEKLAGWSRELSPEDLVYLPETYRRLPALGRLTGRGNTVNLETVVAADPDLIVDLGSVNDTYASLADRVQEQTGVPTILIAGRLDDLPKAYRDLGGVLGVPELAEKQAAWIERALDDVRGRVAAIPSDKRPRVYFARGQEGLETAVAGSINAETLDFVGGINVAGEGIGEGGLATVSLEQIVAWDPEVIVTTDPVFAKAVASDGRWAGIAAVRDKRVYLSPLHPFPWIDFPPSVNRALGIKWLASVLYPEAFPEPIGPAAKEFYSLFYHRDLTDAELASLLNPAGG